MARTEITEVSDERGRPNELNLLQKVRTFWIKGVLEKSLYQEAQLALGLEVRPTAVVRLSETLIQTSEQSTPQPLPPASTIQQVYDEANGQLLILGAPGTGKTTMLLDLTQDLLTRAMRDENHLLPVVFNLSSWAEKRPTLTAWLVDELRLRYDVPRAIAQEWVGKGRILPLLDGLDEVRAEERGACVEAINKYREAHGLDPLVVCSRIAEYEALAARLILTTAVLIQPLSREQVEHYLAELGSPAEGLRQMLAADAELRELAETPLMLNVLLLTYEGGPTETIAEPPPDGSAPSTRVFAAYVERMFERRGADRRYSREQTLHWLAWLARGMTQQGQTLFFLERLQPDWLPTRPLLRRYVLVDRLGSGLVAGVTVGLVVGLIGGLVQGLEFGLIGGLLVGLVGGVAAGLFGGEDERLSGARQERGRLILNGASGGLVVGVVGVLVGMLVGGVGVGQGVGVVGVLVGGVGGLLSGAPSVKPRRIVVVETLRWSQTRARRGARTGAIVGVVIGVVVWVAVGLAWGLLWGLVWALFGALFGALLLGLYYGLLEGLGFWAAGASVSGQAYTLLHGLSGGRVEMNASPNQGVHRSGWSAILTGLVYVLVYVLVYWLVGALVDVPPFGPVFGPLFGLGFGLGFGLDFGLVGGLAYGGYAVLSHVALRLVLWRMGAMPLNYVPFLDYAAERIFLRKVGGGYIFVHRLLLDYFASLEPREGAHHSR